jgi:hypothetical protein
MVHRMAIRHFSFSLLFLLWPLAGASAQEALTLDQIIQRAHLAEQAFEEKLQGYICHATTTVSEPRDDGTFQTIRVVEKTIYRKIPDQRLEQCLSVVEDGRTLSPAEVAEYQRKQAWEKPIAGRRFFSPQYRHNYVFELLSPDTLRGMPTYVLRLQPQKKEIDLVDGMVWLQQEDFEIVRLDVRPAKNPRFIKQLHMIIDFGRVLEDYWLPVDIKIEATGGFLFIKKHFAIHETWDRFQINPDLPDSLFTHRD